MRCRHPNSESESQITVGPPKLTSYQACTSAYGTKPTNGAASDVSGFGRKADLTVNASPIAAAMRPPITSEAERRGSASRWAYLAVVAT